MDYHAFYMHNAHTESYHCVREQTYTVGFVWSINIAAFLHSRQREVERCAMYLFLGGQTLRKWKWK